MHLSTELVTDFQRQIWSFYGQQGRNFAWRNIHNPYRVLVSEIMLQQTQTYRVEPKYEQFITELPDFHALAQAPLRDVLGLWQGLGYNRRGKALHALAHIVVTEHAGQLPSDVEILKTLPGIGPATAGSLGAFAFNLPRVFIETNIRAVYLHSFFLGQTDIHDNMLMPLIEQTLDKHNPREWYYALMDYGVYLKKLCTNPSRASKHHVKQTKFEGSDRQIRGMIIRYLTERDTSTLEQLLAFIGKEPQRVQIIIEQLLTERMLKKNGQNLFI